METEHTPIEVFCSYAHTDEATVRRVLGALDPLVQQRRLVVWQDRQIYAGREWITEIDLHLNTAQIILVFASPAFLASQYCTQVELPRALERMHRREAHLIPIVLEPLDLTRTPFGHVQALPPAGKPISERSDQAEATRSIAAHLEILAKHLSDASRSSTAGRTRLLNLPFRRNPFFTGREERWSIQDA